MSERIKPRFNAESLNDDVWGATSNSSGSDFSGGGSSDDPAFPTFEEIVEGGFSKEEIEKSPKVSIKRPPEILKSTLLFLKGKHKNLYSLSQITRYGSKIGAMVLERRIPSKEIRSYWKKAYCNGDEIRRIKLCSTAGYDFKFRLGLPLPQVMSCYLLRWTSGIITDLSQDLGLPVSILTILSLTAGFAQSSSWIPKNYKSIFLQEAEVFDRWIKDRFAGL